jgi:hypothetical protein
MGKTRILVPGTMNATFATTPAAETVAAVLGESLNWPVTKAASDVERVVLVCPVAVRAERVTMGRRTAWRAELGEC